MNCWLDAICGKVIKEEGVNCGLNVSYGKKIEKGDAAGVEEQIDGEGEGEGGNNKGATTNVILEMGKG